MNELKWIKIFTGIIVISIIVVILRELRVIFIPLTFAIFLAFIFAPLNTILYKHRIPKLFAIMIMVTIIMIFFAGIFFVIYSAIYSVIMEFPKYQERFVNMVNELLVDLQELISRMELIFARMPEWLEQARIISPGDFSVTRFVTTTMGTFFDFGVQLFLTLIFLIFIVAGVERLGVRVKKVLTESRNKQTLNLMHNIQDQIKKYFLNKTLISLGTSLVSMLFVTIFQIDFVLMTGILIFVLNYIPNFGSFIASAFPILICLLQYGFGWRFIGIAIALTMTQVTFGNIIEPKVMGGKLNISPIVVLISLIFWGWVWGPVGMILAIPITSAINIVIKEIHEASIISAIISDE